jgi:hypothetical protein
VVKVAEACCGINSQDYLESFSSFWARADGFQDSDMASELRPRGGLVRTYAVRNTMHTIPAKDYWVHALGGPGHRRFLPSYDKAAKKRGIGDREFRIHSLYEPLLDQFKGEKMTSNEVKQFMIDRLTHHGMRAKMKLQRGWSSKATYGPAWTGISEMCYLGLLVNAGRKGSESLWMSTTDWLGTTRKQPDPEECTVELVRRYIERYGPVTLGDIVYWTFLLNKQVEAALETLTQDLTKESFGTKQEYVSLGSPEETFDPPSAIILPEFDSLLMGHKDKSRILAMDQIKKVFWGLGGIHRTILLDGFVAATWKRKKNRDGMIVEVSPLRKLTTPEKNSIQEEFAGYSEYQKTPITIQFKSG